MHEARKAFIEVESNDNLRRALKTKQELPKALVMTQEILYIIKEKILKNGKAQVKSQGRKTSNFQ